MYLTIALRKEVEDIEEAEILVTFIKAKIEPYPEVTISASVSQTIDPPLEE